MADTKMSPYLVWPEEGKVWGQQGVGRNVVSLPSMMPLPLGKVISVIGSSTEIPGEPTMRLASTVWQLSAAKSIFGSEGIFFVDWGVLNGCLAGYFKVTYPEFRLFVNTMKFVHYATYLLLKYPLDNCIM